MPDTGHAVTEQDLLRYLGGVADIETRAQIARERRIVGSYVNTWFRKLAEATESPLDVDWSQLVLRDAEADSRNTPRHTSTDGTTIGASSSKEQQKQQVSVQGGGAEYLPSTLAVPPAAHGHDNEGAPEVANRSSAIMSEKIADQTPIPNESTGKTESTETTPDYNPVTVLGFRLWLLYQVVSLWKIWRLNRRLRLCSRTGDYKRAKTITDEFLTWVRSVNFEKYCWKDLVYLGKRFLRKDERNIALILLADGLWLSTIRSEHSRYRDITLQTALVSLGEIEFVDANYAEAIQKWNDALLVTSHVFGEISGEAADLSHRIARAYELSKSFRLAAEMYQRAANVWAQLTGEWHLSVVGNRDAADKMMLLAEGNVSDEIASTDSAGGDASSFERHELGLRGFRKWLHRVTSVASAAGLEYWRGKAWEGGHFEEAIRLTKSMSVVVHHDPLLTMKEMEALGKLYCLMGDLDSARMQLTAAIRFIRGFLRDFPWDRDARARLATSSHVLTGVYLQLGDLGAAGECETKCWEGIDRRGEKEYSDLGTSLHMKAILAYYAGHHSQAVDLFKQAAEETTRTLGAQHPLVGAILSNLGRAHQALGETAEATQVRGKGKEILKAVLPLGHPALDDDRTETMVITVKVKKERRVVPLVGTVAV